jgi:hypothetical protein
MLFGDTAAVYCENHKEHTNTLCGQNAEFWYVKAGGAYSNHWALMGYISDIGHIAEISESCSNILCLRNNVSIYV